MTDVPLDISTAIGPLVAELEKLGVAYYVGGSVAGRCTGFLGRRLTWI